ncbi:hypothetical protein KORDIASMS9_01590 [Kordia sp. SMS9]|uniref:DUF4199 domain-containing protein n=1 Tax=Kordia sp. SMS9 TaxID=2282170 RepID=UPI000E0DFD13|nr:DUF4199 domain-containing protein [Kordia sp. SMS9]AXG69370.1 hypothetical protein KORDIASMS9_01590 [Kordia sp. SMS9]
MKNTVLTYGIYSFILASVLFSLALYFGYALAFKTHGIIGYATIVASLVFVYFGIKHYKNHDLDGEIDFKKAFTIGFGIASFSAIAFGLIDAIYITSINPDFVENYIAYEYGLLDTQNLSAAAVYIEKKSIMLRSEVFESATIVFFITLMMVLVVGTIISLGSALVLHKKEE